MMEMLRKRKVFYLVGFVLIILALVLLVLPATLFGQSPATPPPFVPLAPLPLVEYDSGNLGGVLGGIFSFVLGLTVLFAVVVISYGGIQYITTDAIQGKADGKAKLTQALLGLLLAFAAYIILNTINPDLVKFNFSPSESAKSAPTSSGSPDVGGNPSGGGGG